MKTLSLSGRDPVTNLYRAAVRYIESLGGSAVVIGGTQFQQWPSDPKGCFRLAIKFSGLPPRISPVQPEPER